MLSNLSTTDNLPTVLRVSCCCIEYVGKSCELPPGILALCVLCVLCALWSAAFTFMRTATGTSHSTPAVEAAAQSTSGSCSSNKGNTGLHMLGLPWLGHRIQSFLIRMEQCRRSRRTQSHLHAHVFLRAHAMLTCVRVLVAQSNSPRRQAFRWECCPQGLSYCCTVLPCSGYFDVHFWLMLNIVPCVLRLPSTAFYRALKVVEDDSDEDGDFVPLVRSVEMDYMLGMR